MILLVFGHFEPIEDSWRGLQGVPNLHFHPSRASLYHVTVTEHKIQLSLEIGPP